MTKALLPFFLCFITLPAFAQSAVDLQTSIQAGVANGSLTADEAGRLQTDQARLDALRAKALRDGKITTAEQTDINRLQTVLNQRILHQSGDSQTADDPDTRSGERLQDSLQRNVDQQAKIEAGLISGDLSEREAAKALQRQARIDAAQAKVSDDDRISRKDDHRLDRLQDQAGRQIRNDTQQNGNHAWDHHPDRHPSHHDSHHQNMND